MKLITLNTKDKSFQVTEEELESVTVEEWFLSLQIKYLDLEQEEPILTIDEEYEVFKDVYDSFKFRTFIITNISKINYYQKLGEKWLFPEWFLQEIQDKIDEIEKFKELKKHLLEIQVCVNCHQAFKPSENHPEACKFHPGKIELTSFSCCGFKSHYDQPLEYYCRTGYHVVDKFKTLGEIERYRQIFGDS